MGLDQHLYKTNKLPERNPVIEWDEEDFYKEFIEPLKEELHYMRKFYDINSVIKETIPFEETYTSYVILNKDVIQKCFEFVKKEIELDIKQTDRFYDLKEREMYKKTFHVLEGILKNFDFEKHTILYSAL